MQTTGTVAMPRRLIPYDRFSGKRQEAGRSEQRQDEYAERVVVARGKKVVTFDMTKEPPDDDTLAAHLLGPTGNLKAPTLRKGRTLLVGFSEDVYQQVFGD